MLGSVESTLEESSRSKKIVEIALGGAAMFCNVQ
jgi:hypothetical protein